MADRVDLAELEMAFAKDPSSDAFLRLSEAYLDEGRHMEAMVVCKKGIRGQPDSIPAKLLLAKIYAGQGKLPKAVEEVQKIAQETTNNAEVHYVLGTLHDRSARFEDAIAAFKAAIDVDTHHVGARKELKAKGVDYKTGPTPEELAAQAAALEHERERKAADERAAAAASISGGQGHSQRGTLGGARQNRQHAMHGQMPTYDVAAVAAVAQGRKSSFGTTIGIVGILMVVLAVVVGGLYFNKRNHDAIKDEIQNALKVYVRDTTPALKKSIEHFSAVLKIEEHHAKTLARIAMAEQTLVDRGLREFDTDASAHFELAKKYAKSDPDTVAVEMMRHLAAGKPADALPLADDVVANTATATPRSLAVAARVYALSGQTAKVRTTLAMLANDRSPSVQFESAEVWRRIGERTRAMVAYNNALVVEPNHDGARAGRALLALETLQFKDKGAILGALSDLAHLSDLGVQNIGKLARGYMYLGRSEAARLLKKDDESEQDLAKAKTELGTKSAPLMFIEGRQLLASNRVTQGFELLERAASTDAFYLPYWILLIETAAEEKKNKAGEEAYQKAKGIFGEEPTLVAAYVQILGRNNKLDEAIETLKRVPNADTDPIVLRELGQIQLAKNDAPGAIALLVKAADNAKGAESSTRSSIFTLLGRGYQMAEDDEKAIESFGQAISFNSNYAPAYYFVGISLQKQNKLPEAKEAFEKAVEFDFGGAITRKAQQRLTGM